MNDLITLLQKVGPWVFLLGAGTYFWFKHYWPHWKAGDERRRAFDEKQIERMQTLTEVAIVDMKETLHETNVTLVEMGQINQRVANQLESLTNEIRTQHQK